MKIAVLGGAFDPIHTGHLQIARYARKQLGVHEVWFMPAKSSPLKHAQIASFQQRAFMVEKAIQPYRYMRICTLEDELEGSSYTIRSVKALQKRYPKNEFCWLIGDDQAQQFEHWKDSQELKSLVQFYVCSRFCEDISLPHGFLRLSMPLIDVSSSDIRKGHKLYYLPKSVMYYIGRNGLYIESMVNEHMSDKRFAHSVSVANLCVELAKCHQLDTRAAYLMGITHDVCKQLPYDKACIWMHIHMKEEMSQQPAIWHSYIGAAYIKRVFHMYDKRIIQAVYHHVLGRNKTDYDRILYIADKLDPSRGYDSSKEIAISKQDLKKGFQAVKEQQRAYLKKEGTIT